MSRNESLFALSLKSVLLQTQMPDCIVVVDDNNDEYVSADIKFGIESLNISSINYIQNNRTKNMSGTGAWNTGIDFLANIIGGDGFAAILDDDDSWDRDYIKNLRQTISENPNVDAIFAFLKRSDCKNVSVFNKSKLTINDFLIGNPGVQGSNMCFKISNLLKINGFDECLASCTDRDLMIRFLKECGNKNVSIIGKKLVNHFAGNNTVTSCFDKKKNGLDYFYQKHINLFDFQTLEKSLNRAVRLFQYPNSDEIRALYRNNTKVLVTGVCGFIGSHIARKFVKLGYDVVGIDNYATGVFKNIADFANSRNFRFLEISVNDEDILKNVFEEKRFDYVFHFAALPRIKFSIDYPNESYNANVTATSTIGNVAATTKVRLFIFASSSSVYGQCPHRIMTETDALNPIPPYAVQKAESERELQKIMSYSKTNLLILRLFNVYGFSFQPINEYSTLMGKQINEIFTHHSVTINGDGMQCRDFTCIDDVVEAMVNSVEVYKPIKKTEIINIGTGKNYSVRQVSGILQSFFKRTINRKYNYNHYEEPTFTLADNTKAKKMLSWFPKTDLKNGIADMLCKTIENQEIVIGVAMHDNARTIRSCLLSVLGQRHLKRHLRIVLANDNSSDNWNDAISDLMKDTRIALLNLNNCNVVKTRNAINAFIKDNYPNAVLIGRLDADDEYSGEFELSKIEAVFDSENPDLILAGNYLRQNGVVIERKNPADKRLSDKNYVMKRLKQMSEGKPEGELPSCNLFLSSQVVLPYPEVESGEDHALLVHYLFNQDKYDICFAEDLLPVIYDLGGISTIRNRKSKNYIACRKQLYLKSLELCRTK